METLKEQSTHTPGPWRTYQGDGRWIVATTSSWAYAATGLIPQLDAETEEANARLIAAAPDLLEACKQVIVYGADADDAILWTDVIRNIKAAIHKAEGD